MKNYKNLLKNINTFIFDYDGVLTDGTVILQPDGEAIRTANVKDGYALQLAVKKGYTVAIISGGNSASMHRRFEALKIKDFFLGVENKLEVLKKYLNEKNIQPENVLYMGDDIPDHKPMEIVGVPCCPADASPEIKNISIYISPRNGGKGCVRDVIEQTLKLQGKWMTDDGFKW
ncbi:MAG: 3-deoxy-D-manno-octulosonate 8-phosphate phosphatase [Bacteroidetes bacterium 4484_249]|nr:MAG: 3-deoxy-D-manno-octulosonate 8-phosphate phosphatase [Bacteroidetes bacterium 4484_249]